MQGVQTQILFMTAINVLLLIMTALLVLFKARMTVVVIVHYSELLWLHNVRQARRSRSVAALALMMRAVFLSEQCQVMLERCLIGDFYRYHGLTLIVFEINDLNILRTLFDFLKVMVVHGCCVLNQIALLIG